MKATLSLLSAVGLCALIGATVPAVPQEATFVENDGGQQRIVMTGKLRTLSQSVPAAACHLAADLDPAGSIENLNRATTRFGAILNALEMGDPAMGILDAESRRKTIAEIHAVRDTWTPMEAASQAMAAGDVSDANLQILLGRNAEVLDAVSDLLTIIAGEYTNPAQLVRADAFLIDIADRQTMLIQKMSKETCMLTTGQGAADETGALGRSMQIFANTLVALRDGMAAAGIRTPPTPEISERLGEISDMWGDTKPALDAVMAGESLDATTRNTLAQDLNTLAADMDSVVGLYEDAFQ